jgi:hypothetical protein
MNVHTLAEQIDEEAHAYKVGELQRFRAKVHRRRPHTYKLFSGQTIPTREKTASVIMGRSAPSANSTLSPRTAR